MKETIMINVREYSRLMLLMVIGFAVFTSIAWASDLPVKIPSAETHREVPYKGLSTYLSIDMIQSAIKDGSSRGLFIDLTEITRLLDGTEIKPGFQFFGSAYIGPYPFETKEVTYTYKRYRLKTAIQKSRGLLPVDYFLHVQRNSEDWTDEGRIAVRLDLFLMTDQNIVSLGLYDTFVRFKRVMTEDGDARFIKQVSLIEGPMVNLIRSDDPSTLVISFKTDQPVKAAVVLGDGKQFPGTAATRKHEIKLSGLKPGTAYDYHVTYGGTRGKSFRFRTAPKVGIGRVTFAYAGDSREGIGGGAANFMGVNYETMERCANLAYRLGADMFVFGGDLVSGFTTSVVDFRTQIHGWKQAMAGFWNHRPVYSCIGNHETILKYYYNEKNQSVVMDRWPYDTDSVEAVFADELVQPMNGPEPSDPRRPTYKENIYSFQYGPVRFISMNNNYWLGRTLGVKNGSREMGGAPEGYMMEDQFQWLEKELAAAEKDPTVKYIILYAQEPVFPNGGHIHDSMWYNGDNNVRAHTYNADTGLMEPAKQGIVEVRNRLVMLAGNNRKTAAVLGSDEHSYHKLLVDKNVPVGVPAIDDTNGDGVVAGKGETCSPLAGLKYPTWYLVCGGAGAPYYSEQAAPWNTYWKNYTGDYPNHTSQRGCYYYSSQENIFIFRASDTVISMTVYNPYGEIIDRIENLMAVKSNL